MSPLQPCCVEVVLAAPSDSTCPVQLAPGMRPAASAELGYIISELSHVARAYQGLGDVDMAPILGQEIGEFRAENVLLANNRITITAQDSEGAIAGLPPGLRFTNDPRPPLEALFGDAATGSTTGSTAGR